MEKKLKYLTVLMLLITITATFAPSVYGGACVPTKRNIRVRIYISVDKIKKIGSTYYVTFLIKMKTTNTLFTQAYVLPSKAYKWELYDMRTQRKISHGFSSLQRRWRTEKRSIKYVYTLGTKRVRINSAYGGWYKLKVKFDYRSQYYRCGGCSPDASYKLPVYKTKRFRLR